jgi:hypothetical protein
VVVNDVLLVCVTVLGAATMIYTSREIWPLIANHENELEDYI